MKETTSVTQLSTDYRHIGDSEKDKVRETGVYLEPNKKGTETRDEDTSEL